VWLAPLTVSESPSCKPGKDPTGTLSFGLNPKIKNVPYLEDRERDCAQLAVGANAYLGGTTARISQDGSLLRGRRPVSTRRR
jgi:hypothetical protein